MLKLKSHLTCSNCSKIYKDPIILQCNDSIRGEHLKDRDVVKQNKIKCKNCNHEYPVKGNAFESNNVLTKLIESQSYLSDEEKSLKQEFEASVRKFFQFYDDFIQNKTQLESDVFEHFQEMRFQIDQQREELKKKIDDISLGMIDETKKYEAIYLQDLKEKLFENFSSSFDERQSLDNELNQIEDFGSIKLEGYWFSPFKGQILKDEQQCIELLKLCEFSPNDKWSLLYRATRDGFGSDDFHSKCDGHSNTLTILKAHRTSYLFGGFTSVSWDGSSGFKSDPNAFIFSLTNKDNQPLKMKVNQNRYHWAIYCHSGYGPSFGEDICVSNNANEIMCNYSNLGYSYKHAQNEYGTIEAQSFLAGSYEFQLGEIEVYQKDIKEI
jgi:hypothetical protein